MAFVISVTIIGAMGLATASPAYAWDWGGMGYDNARYRDLTHRYLGFRWGYYGWTWGLPLRYRAAPAYYPFGHSPSVPGPGCIC